MCVCGYFVPHAPPRDKNDAKLRFEGKPSYEAHEPAALTRGSGVCYRTVRASPPRNRLLARALSDGAHATATADPAVDSVTSVPEGVGDDAGHGRDDERALDSSESLSVPHRYYL
ncbi:hypothetical protein EVAR_34516_1 [Eumeta japonica]|uniref:Uncharacterized protein n=1 Tax=Eumeta variegata TaxID=151549 RepID=A0A4C1Z6B3_EUMVA|nr:hypothetical protein EVAR_34516_1 [Eumeta japonica]